MAQPKDFGYGMEEQLLVTEAKKFFKKYNDELKLMELVGSNPDPHRKPECLWDRNTWKKMTELGWSTLAVPREAGGEGMQAVTVAALMEEAGRAGLPSPLLSTVNSTYVLCACKTPRAMEFLKKIAENQTATLAVTNRKGSWESKDTDVTAVFSGQDAILNGSAWYVQDPGKSDFFIVSASTEKGPGLYAVLADAPGVTIVPDSILDLTRDQAHILFKDVKITKEAILAEPGKGDMVLDGAMPAILTMLSADMCGAGEWQLQTTAEYARTRVQFDRPIGFFQAVKHPIVNMMIMIDCARSHMFNAACALDHEPDQAPVFARMAKASASDMAGFCSGRSVQYHGGMGFTWECFVQLYFKRQIHSQVLYGDGRYHRAKLADVFIGPVPSGSPSQQ
ncbi:MAG: acyl-CoA dehydrogenase [Desulfobacteraceae bacterium]|nr:acyl-CoA dehydrogenase [Desulfobacteraceae bacterium]MBU4002191.1 acyl-CoA/acyl-ACP dehydrogenase [Pseudomonadota bacterium]